MTPLYRPFVFAFFIVVTGCSESDEPRRLVGQMESDRIEIAAEFGEPITERVVVEGEAVTAGQLLIRQDTARIDARIAEAEGRLGEAQARLP